MNTRSLGKEPQTRLPQDHGLRLSRYERKLHTRNDLAAFDITYGLLRNVASDHKRGVFTVTDTNLRALLAEITILVE